MTKSFTDISQSKTLSKILPLESADMIWISIDSDESFDGNWEVLPKESSLIAKDDKALPCWSLSALLAVLPQGRTLRHDIGRNGYKCLCKTMDTYFYYNPVDACYEMIIHLNELNLL